jgi:predicted metal-dependent hydrolase
MECTINHEPEFWETVQKIMKNPQPEDFRSMKKLSVEGYLALLDK